MATAVLSVVALQSLQRYNFEQGLRRYSDDNLLERLEPLSVALAARYAQVGSWAFISGTQNFTIDRLNRNAFKLDRTINDASRINLNRNAIPKSALGVISLLDDNLKWIAGAQYDPRSATKAILLDDKTIGYLALIPRQNLTRNLDQRFAKQQNRNRSLASLAIIFCALLSAFLISRNLGKPIKELNKQVQSLSDGNYDTRLASNRGDELGSLANNFKKLADTLRNNRDQRRQWISDIAHELRTPVSILQAELECIEDGLQPLDLDSIRNLKSEVERMNLLIDDLHQLSQADSGALVLNCSSIDLVKEIHETLEGYSDQFQQSEFDLSNDLSSLPEVYCDPHRIRQVISNLIQNSLRYTDSPGKLHISGEATGDKVRLVFEDSAPGVAEESIDKIFDRLYRVDPSRNRATGSSGLGLSICASIVAAHNGTISARHSQFGGIAIRIELPITQSEAST